VVVVVVVAALINNVYNFIFLSDRKGTSGYHFTCCIVDEATQSQELETLIPLMLGVNTLVLVGDAQQLPATVLSKVRTSLEPFFICILCTYTHTCVQVTLVLCTYAHTCVQVMLVLCTYTHTCVQVMLVLCLLSHLFALTPIANVDHILVYAHSLSV
jgi:hypothetical protein